MNYVFNCLLLFAIGLNGQAVRENAADSAAISKLNSALMALNDARASQASVSEQVVEGMMLLADNIIPSTTCSLTEACEARASFNAISAEFNLLMAAESAAFSRTACPLRPMANKSKQLNT